MMDESIKVEGRQSEQSLSMEWEEGLESAIVELIYDVVQLRRKWIVLLWQAWHQHQIVENYKRACVPPSRSFQINKETSLACNAVRDVEFSLPPEDGLLITTLERGLSQRMLKNWIAADMY